MPKASSKKRNNASASSPYAQAATKTKAVNSIFKMNTDIGQHILQNPSVAQRIVEKADLKQSDVSDSLAKITEDAAKLFLDCPRGRSRYWKFDCQDSREGKKSHSCGT